MRFLSLIADPPVVFPFPGEHPELSLLLNHDLQARDRGEETEKQNVLFHYTSAEVRFTSKLSSILRWRNSSLKMTIFCHQSSSYQTLMNLFWGSIFICLFYYWYHFNHLKFCFAPNICIFFPLVNTEYDILKNAGNQIHY